MVCLSPLVSVRGVREYREDDDCIKDDELILRRAFAFEEPLVGERMT